MDAVFLFMKVSIELSSNGKDSTPDVHVNALSHNTPSLSTAMRVQQLVWTEGMDYVIAASDSEVYNFIIASHKHIDYTAKHNLCDIVWSHIILIHSLC